ncbi:AlbA family DNA-binding domain-containing protein [Streptomyces albogriseolus]|uniref:AlbA family DNA-binding domain-containing protein n=1 Tax=Streptomyces albogriseolus TaxID=1887 RepID=UPI0036BDEA91
MPTTSDDVKRLLAEPEGQQLEFKIGNVKPQVIAQNISAFANSGGGTIVFGVREDKPAPDRLIGIDEERFTHAMRRAMQMVTPAPPITTEVVSVDGKSFGVVKVEALSSGLVQAAGQAFFREGDRNSQATTERIMRSLPVQPKDPEVLTEVQGLAAALASQTSIIQELREAQSWKAQLPLMLLNGIIGAILGALVAMLLT